MRAPIDCPCGSKKSYQDCCSPLHTGISHAKTAEELMRSRYSAYALGQLDYIKKTVAGKAAMGFDPENSSQVLSSHKWLGLDVVKSDQDFVEFRALYEYQGKCAILHELSEFKQIDGRWFYVAGVMKKSGRNDLCPCHSGKKFKKCHG